MDSVERSELIFKLLQWAENPDGQELCALPKLHWIRRTHQEACKLTYFQRQECNALHRYGSIFMSFQTKCWWYEILELGRKLVCTQTIDGVQGCHSQQLISRLETTHFTLLLVYTWDTPMGLSQDNFLVS